MLGEPLNNGHWLKEVCDVNVDSDGAVKYVCG
jgi:hypothetical protein